MKKKAQPPPKPGDVWEYVASKPLNYPTKLTVESVGGTHVHGKNNTGRNGRKTSIMLRSFNGRIGGYKLVERDGKPVST